MEKNIEMKEDEEQRISTKEKKTNLCSLQITWIIVFNLYVLVTGAMLLLFYLFLVISFSFWIFMNTHK